MNRKRLMKDAPLDGTPIWVTGKWGLAIVEWHDGSWEIMYPEKSFGLSYPDPRYWYPIPNEDLSEV